MAIDRDAFAEQCLLKALYCGVNVHYMLGVAQLRSGISDTNQDDQIGPFRLKQAEWDANSTDSDFDFNYAPGDINNWAKQCSVFALMVHRAWDAFVASKNRTPTAMELYLQQWPGASTPTLATDFLAALNKTAPLLDTAATAVLDDPQTPPPRITDPNKQPPPPPPSGSVRTSGAPVPAGRQAIAQQIVTAFANAGLGTFQQAAGLANAIAESALDPNAHEGAGEDSWGLFQLNRKGGLGSGFNPADLVDPAKNISIVLGEAKKFSAFTLATSLDQAVSAFVRDVERPADASGQIIKRLGIAQKLLS